MLAGRRRERAADVADRIGVDAEHLQQREAVGALVCSDHPVDGAGQVAQGDVGGDAVRIARCGAVRLPAEQLGQILDVHVALWCHRFPSTRLDPPSGPGRSKT